MISLNVTGEIQRPLTHMALWGLAAILEDSGLRAVQCLFTEDLTPRAQLEVDADSVDVIGAVVREHAVKHAENSWVTATMTHESDPGKGVMSPRLKPPSSPESWSRLQQERYVQIGRLLKQRMTLDLRMIGGLGEPAYWRCTERNTQPDQGASRWEMKARNKGEEFVANRLAFLARAVAARDAASVMGGVTGELVDDYVSKADSRSATGFAPPGPVDSALVWCALWGLANFPVVHDGTNRSRTPGAQRWDRVHPDVMVVPVFTVPTAPARLRGVLRSHALDRMAAALVSHEPEAIQSQWLAEHGVRALMRFPVARLGSPSAPERRVLDGTVIPLE